MSESPKTPKEVADAVKAHFKEIGFPLMTAAGRMGLTPQAVSNQLAGKAYLSKKMALVYQQFFGLNPHFLHTGEGKLLDPAFNNSKLLSAIEASDYRLEDRIVKLEWQVRELTSENQKLVLEIESHKKTIALLTDLLAEARKKSGENL